MEKIKKMKVIDEEGLKKIREIVDETYGKRDEIFYPFSLLIEGGKLVVHGADKLLEAGYVPYIFRYVKKCNRKKIIEDDVYVSSDRKIKKGWCVYFSNANVRINNDNVVEFSMPSSSGGPKPFGINPESFINIHTDTHGDTVVGYGQRPKVIQEKSGKIHSVVLKYGIGFGKPKKNLSDLVTTADLVTTVIPFNIRYCFDSGKQTNQWVFSR